VKRILLVAVLLLAIGGAAVVFLVPRGRAQVQLTLEPSMAKGAADSRVTIVEFSDYQ
jgi:hypothetical protein